MNDARIQLEELENVEQFLEYELDLDNNSETTSHFEGEHNMITELS